MMVCHTVHKNIGGQFYHLISDMYSKSKCAVKNGKKRSSFFDYDRGVRQGCILSPSYLSNTPTNLCTPLYCILLYCVVLNCIVLLIYCYVDIIQYNGVHKFVGVLDNPLLLYCSTYI